MEPSKAEPTCGGSAPPWFCFVGFVSCLFYDLTYLVFLLVQQLFDGCIVCIVLILFGTFYRGKPAVNPV